MINDYLVRWVTANRDKVAPQLTHYETNSFAVQNQASHIASNLMLREGKAAGIPNPPLIDQGTTIKRLGIPIECAPESGLIDENTQSGLRMISWSDKILRSPHRGVQRYSDSTFLTIQRITRRFLTSSFLLLN
jgi:hypothetical protein